jgi:hypothetical protein
MVTRLGFLSGYGVLTSAAPGGRLQESIWQQAG